MSVPLSPPCKTGVISIPTSFSSDRKHTQLHSHSQSQSQSPPPSPSPSPLIDHHADSIHFYNSSNVHHKRDRASLTLRQVQRVSKRAVLTSKRKIWDSNDASIDAAQQAVDHWEHGYTAVRGLLVASAKSAQGFYGAAKTGASGLEHGLLSPVRDWILMPAFWGVERIAEGTTDFLQSPQATQVAGVTLDVVKKVPFGIGQNVLAPALVVSAECVQSAWCIVQYPIPSRTTVRDCVDSIMTGTKWALTTTGREIYFYAKLADANITRTLMHTRWKVLGSGPYATLDDKNKQEVVDHICERYFSVVEIIARYELAAYIRARNRKLYHDLVLSGILRQRGGKLTRNDEWLSVSPCYRTQDIDFLLSRFDSTDQLRPTRSTKIVPLWFRLPYQNGKSPGKDVPWIGLSEHERLEQKYLEVLAEYKIPVQIPSADETEPVTPLPCRQDARNHSSTAKVTPHYPTVAQWYEPEPIQDILVHQKRQAVSYCQCCPACRTIHGDRRPPLLRKQFGSFCDKCETNNQFALSADAMFSPPPLAMVMRPTMWRFHGPGDEIRRAVWLMDTKRHGLQPYNEESAIVLEDAYLFLKWKLLATRKNKSENNVDDAGELLTVQVTSPDGAEQQLVQFRSLTQVTAISKTLGGALSLWKRRVYRGAYMHTLHSSSPSCSNELDESSSVPITEDSVESYASTGLVHDFPVGNIRERVSDFPVEETPIEMVKIDITEEQFNLDPKASLSAPISLLNFADSEIRLSDVGEDDEIDHLVLVIHGIGEMLRTVDLFGIALPTLSSIIDCCAYLRDNHPQLQTARVEYIPVEWHEAFALQSQRTPEAALSGMMRQRGRSSNTTMDDISLKSIPQMRTFANDTLLDVLYFMSAEHHDKIMDIVTSEMNFVIGKFRSLTGFNGKISVLGHSLGSIVAWDILANQSQGSDPPCPNVTAPPDQSQSTSEAVDAFCDCPDIILSNESTQEGDPQLNAGTSPQLTFQVDNTFLLGSPVSVFLMIRNQHEPLSEDFYLPGCRRVFNLFHPFDPVAYRIEPLIDNRNVHIAPRIVPHWKGGFRVQYQTKILWKKLVDTTWKTQQHLLDSVEARMARLGLLGSSIDVIPEDEDLLEMSSDDDNNFNLPTCGKLNGGRRIDYMLQEREIESANEYVAAFAAHSSYWVEKDLSYFIARQIARGSKKKGVYH